MGEGFSNESKLESHKAYLGDGEITSRQGVNCGVPEQWGKIGNIMGNLKFQTKELEF